MLYIRVKEYIMNMPKKVIFIIIAVIVLISLAIGGYFFWNNWKKSASSQTKNLEKAGEAVDEITESTIKGVLPSIQTNPLENKPDVNPTSKTNPYKNIIINPF